MNRREFVRAGSACAVFLAAGGARAFAAGAGAKKPLKRITVARGTSELEPWPTKGAFGFKGVVQKRKLGWAVSKMSGRWSKTLV